MTKEDSTPNPQKSIKQRIVEFFPVLTLVGIAVGAIGGFIYYYFIGCTSGSCAITSNPYMSILWGAIFGYLVFDMFNRKPKKESKDNL